MVVFGIVTSLLKDTGSCICDTNMSAYLKVASDMIYGERNFINENPIKNT